MPKCLPPRISTIFGFSLIIGGCAARPAPPLPDVKARFSVTSTTFANNGVLPSRCSADSGNVSPELEWQGIPATTKSLALVMEDLDSPGPSPFVHWVLLGIPPNTTIAEGTVPEGAKPGFNDAGTQAYFGPKPPRGTHRYVFRLYALDKDLPLAPGATKAAVVQAMAGHELAMGELTAQYTAK